MATIRRLALEQDREIHQIAIIGDGGGIVARRALIVGIDTYNSGNNLNACVADAKAMAELLSRHKDGEKNFDCILLLDRMEDGSPITRPKLRAFFEVDRHYVAVAALRELAEAGTIDPKVVADAIAKYELDPETPQPTTV